MNFAFVSDHFRQFTVQSNPMGQYFIIFNVTKKESVKPAFANWKLGEWDWDQVIQIMGWDGSDEIYACGDYGSMYYYNPAENDGDEVCDDEVGSLDGNDYDELIWSCDDSEQEGDETVEEAYKQKYICEIRRIVLDQPYQYDEYSRLMKSRQSTVE